MLGIWRTHAEYQEFAIRALMKEAERNPQSLKDFEPTILKLLSLNLDSVKVDFSERFSPIGRPSTQQPEIFRAVVLMCDQRCADVDKWRKTAVSMPLFCALIGVEPADFPGASTIRDFYTRLYLAGEPDHVKAVTEVEPKPKDKHGKNKRPPKNPGIIKELVDKALSGETFSDIPEALFQRIFAKVAVKPSIEAGLIKAPGKLTVSADRARKISAARSAVPPKAGA